MREVIAIASALCLTALPVMATPEGEAKVHIATWASAYAERDHKKATAHYSPGARLRPGDALTWRGLQSIAEYYYFDAQRFKDREITLSEQDCRVYDDATAQCTGLLKMQQTTIEGETQKQFTHFGIGLVRGDEGQWMIDGHQQVQVTPSN